MKELWFEKYRPKDVNSYVFKDTGQKNQVQSWVDTGAIPHLLFSGAAGTGKTTLAKILLHELGVDWGDVLEINASTDNGVDYIRDTITGFTSSMPFGEFKYVLLDEADYLSPNAQAALRGVMERYSNTARFLLTCNYPNRIIPAIHSRCQGFHIDKLDRTEFTARMATILITEGIQLELPILDDYVKVTYPDMRKCINLIQQNSQSGALVAADKGDSSAGADYKLEMISLFRAGEHKKARKLICDQISEAEYEDMYRFMYDNLELWAEDNDKQNEAVIIIKKGLVDHVSCADPEICLSATLIMLEML